MGLGRLIARAAVKLGISLDAAGDLSLGQIEILLNEHDRDRAEYFSLELNVLLGAIGVGFGDKAPFELVMKMLREVIKGEDES